MASNWAQFCPVDTVPWGHFFSSPSFLAKGFPDSGMGTKPRLPQEGSGDSIEGLPPWPGLLLEQEGTHRAGPVVGHARKGDPSSKPLQAVSKPAGHRLVVVAALMDGILQVSYQRQLDTVTTIRTSHQSHVQPHHVQT